jgi:hypothetical protein
VTGRSTGVTWRSNRSRDLNLVGGGGGGDGGGDDDGGGGDGGGDGGGHRFCNTS